MPATPRPLRGSLHAGHLAAHEDIGFSGGCRARHGDRGGADLPPRHHAVVVAPRLRLLGQHLRDRHRNRRAARPRYASSPQQRAHRRHPEVGLRGELSRHVREQYRPHRLFAGGRHRHNRAPPLPCPRAPDRHAVAASALRPAVPAGDVQRQADAQLFPRHERNHLADGGSVRHPERCSACPRRRRRELELAAAVAARRAYRRARLQHRHLHAHRARDLLRGEVVASRSFPVQARGLSSSARP